MSKGPYVVIPESEGVLGIMDMSSKIIGRTVRYTDKLVSPPMVTGNECTFVVENHLGSKRIVFMELPSGMTKGSKCIS